MVRAADFGNGKSALFGLQCQWRTAILRYGDLRAALARVEPGTAAWHGLSLECNKTVLALYTRAGEMELDAQRYHEMVAEET